MIQRDLTRMALDNRALLTEFARRLQLLDQQISLVRRRLTMARNSTIGVADLRIERGGNEVLHGVSLEVKAGSVTGLLGPSGCGKSTLMRAIVGVQVIASRRQSIVLGEPAGTPQLRSRVGYVTQAPSIYADLSVEENLRYFAAVLGSEF